MPLSLPSWHSRSPRRALPRRASSSRRSCRSRASSRWAREANAEYVVVHNTAAKAKNIRGWFIREKKLKRTFTFPGFTLCGGCSVKIHSGHGSNTGTDLYWGRAAGAWVDTGDTAILHRAAGLVQGRCTYPPSTGGVTVPPRPGKVYGC